MHPTLPLRDATLDATLAGGVVLHAGHADPVAADPLVSFVLRIVLAATAGFVAAAVTLVPVRTLRNGDVVPVLFVAAVTGTPVTEVTDHAAWTAVCGCGALLAALGQGLAIAGLGLRASEVGSVGPIALQVLVAGVVAELLAFVGGIALVARYEDDDLSVRTVRGPWVVCAATFGVAYVLVRTGLFAVPFG